jgi:hypothetical protein
MKSISKYFLIALLLFVIQNAFAQEGDAVFNKVIHEYTLNADGSSEYHDYKEIKLLSHMSFHRLYGETFVIFDPEYQDLQINEAYTIMADGQKVVVPDNAFNEVLPRGAAHAAPYNKLREMVITHTGLEVGATIYLDYTLKTKAGFVSTFMGEESIKDIVPVTEKIVKVRIPAGQELQYKVLNIRTAPEISLEEDMQVYTFTFKELSAYTHEWGVDQSLLPRLFFSTAKDLDRAYFSFVGQPAFTYPANADMVAAVDQIVKENNDDLKAALAIQKMVVEDIASWNLPLEYTGFKCRTPVEVWESNGGTPLEKTVLLATLLMKAKLSGAPVAIIPEKYFDKKVGSLYIFRDFAAMAKVGMGEKIFLSATHTSSQNLAYSELGNIFLLLDGAVESLRTFEPIKDKAEIIYHGKYTYDENNTLKGELKVTLGGAANPYYKLSVDSAFAKRYGSGVEKAVISKLQQDKSILDIEVNKKDAFKIYGNHIFIPLAQAPSGIDSWGFSYIETGRQAPIKLKGLVHEQYHDMITLPDDYTLISQEANFVIVNALGSTKISTRQEGNIVYTTREIEIHKDLIQFSEFDLFRELWNPWVNPIHQKIVLKKQ